jgi:hypothetical protein
VTNVKGARSSLIFRGGIPQRYFPGRRRSLSFWAFRFLFRRAATIACDNDAIADAIAAYGVSRCKISAITPFSPQYVAGDRPAPDGEFQAFLQNHDPVWLSYVCYREEYGLPEIRQCMTSYRERYPSAGFVWVGFPEKELPEVQNYVASWAQEERAALLVRGNVEHAMFLALIAHCTGYLRTPGCDGISASVLEALTLKKPVVASENGRRPPGVVTYRERDAAAMSGSLIYVTEHHDEVMRALHAPASHDNVARMADWLAGGK